MIPENPAFESPLHPETIPDELKTIPRWLLWKLETRDGKPTKTPYQTSGALAKVNDPTTWTDFDTILAAYLRGGWSGIGIVLTDDDDLVGVDLDKCLNQDTGELDPEASCIVAGLPTYCEISPSGRGLRLFGFGKLPQGGRRKGRVEMYEAGRYLTVTGHRFNGHAALAEITPQLAQVHARIFGSGKAGADSKPVDAKPAADPPDLDDSALLDKARRARNGADFERLWAGDTSGHGGDDSAADLALCNALAFWTRSDAARMDRLFRQSGLMRPKWDEKHYADGRTYGQATVGKAIAGSRETYSGRSADALEHGRQLAESLRNQRQRHEPDDDAGWGRPPPDEYADDALSRTCPSCGFPAEYPDCEHCGYRFDEPKPDQSPTGTTGKAPENPLLVPVSRFIGDRRPPTWTIRRWLPAASLVVLFGEPGCGKSFLAVDWACHVAAGLDWNGNRVKPGAVVYLAGEGHHGLKRRFDAWQQRYGALPDHLYVSKRAVSFTPAGATEIFESIGEIPEVPVLIQIDTLATTLAGDESHGEDMNVFISYLKHLLENTGATIVIVHHSGHSAKERARGHSSLKGAIDAEYRVERTEGIGTLTCTKPKDFDPQKPLNFELEIVELPADYCDPDEPDEPATTCLFKVTGEQGESRGKIRKPTPNQTIALKALDAALIDHGAEINGEFGVHIDHWRSAAYQAGIGDTPETKKKNFKNVRIALLASGEVRCRDDVYRFTDPGRQSIAAMLNRQRQDSNKNDTEGEERENRGKTSPFPPGYRGGRKGKPSLEGFPLSPYPTEKPTIEEGFYSDGSKPPQSPAEKPSPVDSQPPQPAPLPPTASSDAGELWAILKHYRGWETFSQLAKKLGWPQSRVIAAAQELQGFGRASISGEFVKPVGEVAA